MPAASTPVGVTDIGDWSAFVGTLNIDGAARQLAAHCALVAQSPFDIRLMLDKRNGHLLTDNLRGRLTMALQERLGSTVKVLYAIAEAPQDTPAARLTQTDDADLRQARERIAADSNVRQMTELFGAEVIPESIRKSPNPLPRK
jgi:DNA polymerase-3 subunit gamma/tau